MHTTMISMRIKIRVVLTCILIEGMLPTTCSYPSMVAVLICD